MDGQGPQSGVLLPACSRGPAWTSYAPTLAVVTGIAVGMSLSGVATPLLTKGMSVVCADVVSVEFAGTDPAGMFVKMTPMLQSIWNVLPLPQPPTAG